MQWLIHHGKEDKALAILAKYHANGQVEDELIRYEYEEICYAIRHEEENKRTSFMDFFATPGNRRRLLVLLTMATGSAWVGNGIITYYLSPALKLVGITSNHQICMSSPLSPFMSLFNSNTSATFQLASTAASPSGTSSSPTLARSMRSGPAGASCGFRPLSACSCPT